jgi:RNA polymerase sigma factor (sigma-70 family)
MAGDAPSPDAGRSRPQPGPADQQLIARLLSGDEDAARLLIERYDRLIRYTIFKTGKRHCDRDPGWLDARANEAWTAIVSALRRRGVHAIPPKIPAYFATIARNKALDAVAQADARTTVPFDSAAAESGPPAEPASDAATDPASMLENVEQLSALREAILLLNADDQRICGEIELILERRWREAAQRLALPESTLRSRWGHILDKLRANLEQKKSK